MRAFVVLVVIGLVAATVAGCGGSDGDEPVADSAGASEVTVNLTNWAVEPSAKTLAAGKVKFTATHAVDHGGHGDAGGATHQLVVAPLPDGAKAGRSQFGSPVMNLADLKPGETMTAEAELAPGAYELACLVVEEVEGKMINHYAKGMYTRVVVK